jgi:hypothetical protein
LVSLVLVSSHFVSLGPTCSHLVSLVLTWSHLFSLGLTYSTWSHLVSQREKGKADAYKGKRQRPHTRNLTRDVTRQPDRAHARTTRNETTSRLCSLPPTSDTYTYRNPNSFIIPHSEAHSYPLMGWGCYIYNIILLYKSTTSTPTTPHP